MVKIDTSSTVLELKVKVQEQLNVAPAQQRLIYKGRVLKDEATVESYGVENEHTIHMVKSGAAAGAASAPSSSGSTTTPASAALPSFSLPPASSASGSSTSSGPTSQNPFANPFAMGGLGGLGGLSGPGGMAPGNMNRLQEQLLQSPEMMEQVMNSPMMQALMDNPEFMRNIMMNNPQMQGILDANPQLRQMLNDPAVCQQNRRRVVSCREVVAHSCACVAHRSYGSRWR